MKELTEFVGFCYYWDRDTDEYVELGVTIVATTQAEARGLLLEKYPKTKSCHWDVVGGKVEDVEKYGTMDEHVRNISWAGQ